MLIALFAFISFKRTIGLHWVLGFVPLFVVWAGLRVPVRGLRTSFKATLVIWYFMHVKYASKLTKLTVATGIFFLAILLGLFLVDYGSKAFTLMPPFLS